MSMTIQSSAARRLTPTQAAAARAQRQPALRLVGATEVFTRKLLGKATLQAAVLLSVGLVGVFLLGLHLSIMIQQGSYQLSGLKAQMTELTTTNQILDEQVRSLGSDQNLANAASHLGMVTNANPVYLRLSDGKVIGHPRPAVASSEVRIGKNVVPNAALVATTTSAALASASRAAEAASQAAKAAAAASASAVSKSSSLAAAKAHPSAAKAQSTGAKAAKTNVAAKNLVTPQVTLASSGIPVSPTN
jgi:hypothetical protein